MTVAKKICEEYAQTIRQLRKVDIPAGNASVANWENRVAELRQQGVEDSEMPDTLAALDQAKQDLASALGQLEAFSEEFDAAGCVEILGGEPGP